MAFQPVYSTLLISEPGFTGEASLEIPSGDVCVVRSIDAVVGITAGLSVWAYGTDGAGFWGYTWGATTYAKQSASWRGRQVIPGPGFFYISTDGACDIRASGYILSAP